MTHAAGSGGLTGKDPFDKKNYKGKHRGQPKKETKLPAKHDKNSPKRTGSEPKGKHSK